MLEKEFKFRIREPAKLIDKLEEMGAKKVAMKKQQDMYLDNEDGLLFKTGRALRIRKENGHYYLTYKEKILHKKPKTRNEETIKISENQAEFLLKILEKLGFKKKLIVNKTREEFDFNKLKFFVDRVEGLDYFLEIEISTEDEEEILNVLEKLGLNIEDAIDKTYPEMLKI